MTDSEALGTGERSDVEGQPISHEQLDHIGRYRWALPQVSGRILDVACGTGYGMALLSQRGAVSGLDAHEGAVQIARSRGLDAEVASVPPIGFPEAEFDAVVTFETVEHIKDDAAYLAELERVLKPGGLLLLSTPNKDITSPDGPPANRWHVREYRLPDLQRLLANFENVEVFGQGAPPTGVVGRLALRVVARFPSLCRPGRWWDRLAHGAGEVRRWDGRSSPVIWVLRARRGATP